MAEKKIDTELLRAMMMGAYDPEDNHDLLNDWTDNDLHYKGKQAKTGETLQQQITKCLKVVDKAVVTNQKQVTIIHGKGTGILRKAVHKELRKHPQVKKFEINKENEGQTTVYLK